MTTPPIPVLLDTDIGDDIDDVFCLALLLACPELSLQAVTTTWGRTAERVEIVLDLCATVGATPPSVGGFVRPMASRPFPDALLQRLHYPAPTPTSRGRCDPGRVLELYAGLPGDGVVLTIGAMTNLAAALLARQPGRPFPRVVCMAGEFQRYGHIEFNVRCDPEAAHLAFTSGVPIDVIPWSIGPATRLLEPDIARLRAATSPLAQRVVDYLERFWKIVPNKTNMYDPMTAVALLQPDLFDWKRGHVSVELRGEKTYGLTLFHLDDAGPHRVAFGVNADLAKAFLVDRLTRPTD